MELTLDLPIKPYSVNEMYYGNRAILKSEYRQWTREVILQLTPYQTQILEFTKYFDQNLHCIYCEIVYIIPKEILVTKAGYLSSKAMDCSNIEKPLLDALTYPKHSLDDVKNLEIDDKFIVDLHSKKIIGEKYKTIVKFRIKSLSDHLNITQP